MAIAESVRFLSGGLSLEGELYSPTPAPSAIVVVCHPHPLRGGDMHNNVVMLVAHSLVEIGIAALTFNFRGVGASEGLHNGGAGERDDVLAAIDLARSIRGMVHVGLAGYSFGAGMAAAVVDDAIAALCLVSPPGAMLGAGSAFRSFSGPSLLISGDADHVSSPDALRTGAEAAAGDARVVTVAGADHFWRGHEAALEDEVRRFFGPLALARAP